MPKAVLSTLDDVLNMISSFVGGSVPAVDDEEYVEQVRWIQLGQQDAANRGFWRRLLTKADLVITADEETTELPENFYKVNGIYGLFANGVDWSRPNNSDDVKIFVEMNPETGVWQIRWLPEAPTSTVTADLWYYFNPPIPTEGDDPIFLDGEMVGYYALKEYFRKLKQLGSQDDARIEYENRFSELLSLEMMPSPQEMLSFSSFNQHLNTPASGRQFYNGRSGRGRSR